VGDYPYLLYDEQKACIALSVIISNCKLVQFVSILKLPFSESLINIWYVNSSNYDVSCITYPKYLNQMDDMHWQACLSLIILIKQQDFLPCAKDTIDPFLS